MLELNFIKVNTVLTNLRVAELMYSFIFVVANFEVLLNVVLA